MDYKKVKRAVSLALVVTFLATNTLYGAPSSHLRVPNAFDLDASKEFKKQTGQDNGDSAERIEKVLGTLSGKTDNRDKETFPVKMVDRSNRPKPREGVKVVADGNYRFNSSLKSSFIEINTDASQEVKKVAIIHTYALQNILNKYQDRDFDYLMQAADASGKVEFIEDNDTLMDIAPASNDISDLETRVIRFDIDLANNDVADIDIDDKGVLTSKDPEILLGTAVLSALGQYHEWCHCSGMDEQLAVMKTFDLYDILSQEEKTALHKVLDAGRIDGNNSFAMALKAQSDHKLAKQVEEWDIEMLLSEPSSSLHKIGLALSQKKTNDVANIINSGELKGNPSFENALKDVLKGKKGASFDNDKKERLIVNIERALRWKNQWALWLIGQEMIDVPYDQKKVAALLEEESGADIDQKRIEIHASLSNSFDNNVEGKNIKTVTDTMRENGVMIVCGRVSRAFGNQMIMLSNSQEVKDNYSLQEVILKLQEAAKGIADFTTSIDRFRNLAFGKGKEKKVFVTQLKGASWHMRQDLYEWEKKELKVIDRQKELNDRKIVGKKSDNDFRNKRRRVQRKVGEIAGLLDEYDETLRLTDAKNSAYLILQQRFFPGETQRIAQLNYGQDAFPGKIEILRDMFRSGGAFRYATPGVAMGIDIDGGKKGSLSWVQKTNHWIEAIPMFIKERIIKEKDANGLEIEKIETEVDQAGMEAFFRFIAEEWAKNCDEVMDSEHIALAREMIVADLLDKGVIKKKGLDSLSDKLGREEAIRQIVIENGLGDRVAELASMIGKAYEDHIEEVSLYKDKNSVTRVDAVREVIIKKRIVTSENNLPDSLKDKADKLREEAYKKRRPVSTLHVLTTESAGMTNGFSRTWLESEMSMYNVIKAKGWEGEVDQKIRGYRERLEAISRKVINDFGMWSEVEEAKIVNNLRAEDDARAISIVIATNRPLAEEVAKLATLIEFYERESGTVDFKNAKDPVSVNSYIKKNRSKLENTARAKTVEFNGRSIEERIEYFMKQGLKRKDAELKAIMENENFKEDFDNFVVIEARAGLLTELDKGYAHLGLEDKSDNYIRNHTALAKSWARREVIAAHKAQGLTDDPLYNYTAKGGKKRYNLVYGPSRVDLGSGEYDSVVRWPQWVGAIDWESENAGREFYSQINESGVVVRPWLEWQEMQKTAENANMTAGKAFSNTIALTAKAIGKADAQWLMDQMSLREDKDRGTPSPSEGYAGYCVPKDGLFLAFVLSLKNKRKLEQINIPDYLHPLVMGIARKALLKKAAFSSEFEWEMWVAKELLGEDALAGHLKEFIDIRKSDKADIKEEELLVFNITKIIDVVGSFGKPDEFTAGGNKIFNTLSARMAQKVTIEEQEQLQRFMVFYKVAKIREALKKAGREKDASMVFAAEYKKVQDIRFSAGLRKHEMLSKTGEGLWHQLSPEGQALYHLDEFGFTRLSKLEKEKTEIENMPEGDEKLRRLREIDKKMMASKKLYDEYDLKEGQSDEVISRLESEFRGAAIPKDIRIVSSTMASILDIMHYYDDTQLEQLATQCEVKLAEYGLTDDQIRANSIVYGGDLSNWAIIKDLSSARKQKLLNSKIYIRIKGEPHEYPIEGAIHALVLKARGPFRSYLEAIQGADVVDFGIDFPELLDVAYNYPKFVKLMLTDNPHSALIVSDTGVGRISRSFTYEDVKMFFASCDSIAGEGRGQYIGIDIGEDVVDNLRKEMDLKRTRSENLIKALDEVIDSNGNEKSINMAEGIYDGIREQVIYSNEAEIQLEQEERDRRYKRSRPRDRFITEGLSRMNQGLDLADLDFGTWLAMGGRYVVIGKSEEEIRAIRERFDKAVSMISASSGRDTSSANFARLNKEEEEKVVKALAIPEFVPEAQKFVQEFGKEGSSKAVEASAKEALQKRAAYKLKEIRLRAFREREDAFKKTSKDIQNKDFTFCIGEAQRSLKNLRAFMTGLYNVYSGSDSEDKAVIRDKINRSTGEFLAYAKQGLISIVNEMMPEGTKEEKEAKDRFLKNIDSLYTGREINIDIWRLINGGYRDPKGDFGRLAEAVKGDKAKLEKIAEAGIELFYATLAIGQTAEFLQLERTQVDQEVFWHGLADFFGETMYDHRCSYMPYIFTKGEGYKVFSQDELYKMASDKHQWLDGYLLDVYSHVTDIADWSQEEKDAYFGSMDTQKDIIPISNNAPTEDARRWRSYNTKRQIAFNMSDGFSVPVVFPEFDPDIIDAGNRVNVVFLFPAGRTHIARAWREGPTMNEKRLLDGKSGVNILVNRYDEFKNIGGEEECLMNNSAHMTISKEEFVEALKRHKGYKKSAAIIYADGLERQDFIKSMMLNTKCSYDEAEEKAVELQKKGVKISKGITVAVRFTTPVRSDNVIPYHGAELYDKGELEKHRLPTTVQNLALTDVTYDKSLYGDIFNESGVRLPSEINWRLEYEIGPDNNRLSEDEILKRIIEGVEGTDYIGLRKFSEKHNNILQKGSAESGARNLDTFTVLSDEVLLKAARFAYEVSHARSEGQNVTIQEALLMSPEVWASQDLLGSFVDRQIMEWQKPVKRETYPKSRIYSTLRGIFSSSDPAKEYDITHPIVLMSLQVATNVGRGGTLDCLLGDFIQPEYQEMVMNELKEKGSIVNKALSNYLKSNYSPKRKKGEDEEIFNIRKNTEAKDLIGRPYWWVPYEMNDFAFNIIWEKPGELVDVEPVYNETGKRIGGRPILKDADGKRFEGKIKSIELVLLEPNIGIGLWPNYSKREEAHEWQNALKEKRELNLDNIGVSDRKVIENIGVIPGEQYRDANFGPEMFTKGPSKKGPSEIFTGEDKGIDDIRKGVVFARAEQKARAALGLNKDAKFTLDEMSVLAKYIIIEEAKNLLSVSRKKSIEDLITNNMVLTALSKIVDSGLLAGDVKDFSDLMKKIDYSMYFSRINKLAIEEIKGGYRTAPELEIVPRRLSEREAKELLGDRENFAVVFEDTMNFTNEFYPLIQDSYVQGMDVHNRQTRNVIGVNRYYLTQDGKAERIMVYNHDTGKFKEIELKEPFKIDRALALYTSKEGHKKISEVLANNDIEEVNPYGTATSSDNKSKSSWILSQADMNVPYYIFVDKRKAIDRYNIMDLGLEDLLDSAKAKGLDKVVLIVQPNSGTEGELAKAFTLSVSNPDLRELLSYVQKIQNSNDDVIIREFIGNVRYSEDGGKTSYACTFRINVTGDGENYEANSGYLQVAGDPDSLIASVGQGGRIVEFPEAFERLYVDLGDGNMTRIGRDDIKGTLINMMQESTKKAARLLNLKFAGIDINFEYDVTRGDIKSYILDINPRPAGLTHSVSIDPERQGNIFTFWEKSKETLDTNVWTYVKDGFKIYNLTDPKTGSSFEVIPEKGALVYSFKANGQEILLPTPDLKASPKGIPFMAPTPNRVEQGISVINGQKVDLNDIAEISDDGKGNRIHGPLRNMPWKVESVKSEKDSVIIECSVDTSNSNIGKKLGNAEYRLIYTLKGNTLRKKVVITNKDNKPIDVGFGWHDWANAIDVNYWEAFLPAGKYCENQPGTLLPTGNLKDAVELGIEPGRIITLQGKAGGFDNVLTDLRLDDDGWATSFIYNKENGTLIRFRQDGKYLKYIVFFTHADGKSICVEAQSCMTNAHNLKTQGLDSGLVTIKPQETIEAEAVIEVENIGPNKSLEDLINTNKIQRFAKTTPKRRGDDQRLHPTPIMGAEGSGFERLAMLDTKGDVLNIGRVVPEGIKKNLLASIEKYNELSKKNPDLMNGEYTNNTLIWERSKVGGNVFRQGSTIGLSRAYLEESKGVFNPIAAVFIQRHERDHIVKGLTDEEIFVRDADFLALLGEYDIGYLRQSFEAVGGKQAVEYIDRLLVLNKARMNIDNLDLRPSQSGANILNRNIEMILANKMISDNFVTHYVIDYLNKHLDSSDIDRLFFDKAIAEGFKENYPEIFIINNDFNVPVKSLFDLVKDKDIKREMLISMIFRLKDYTNKMDKSNIWAFDSSSRAMRFISAALDELKSLGVDKIGLASSDAETGLLGTAKQKFTEIKNRGSYSVYMDLVKLSGEIDELSRGESDVTQLAKKYEQIVPRLINLKVIHFYEEKYGKPYAGTMSKEDQSKTIEVTFPVGISYSRSAWDNLGRVSRDPKETVRYLLAGIKFLREKEEVPAGTVAVKRLKEPQLILNAKSYDAKLVISLDDLDTREKIDKNGFFDYSGQEGMKFRLLKEALVANGIIREESDSIKEDILRFTDGGGLEITVDTIVPGGTGLGTSGAVSTALCVALDWFTNHKGSVDSEILDRSVYLEHRLGLGSGTQDCRRPVEGSSPFKIGYQEGGKPFPSVSFEFLDSVDPKEARESLVLFFPGFRRQATGRLNTVLSGYLARDRYGYQAMRDVIRLQDIIEEDGFKKNDYETVGSLSAEYQNYRDIMDPTQEEHVLKAIAAIKKAPGIWGANFTGSPGGVMMIWCPKDKRQEVVDYLNGLKDDLELTYNNEPIFKDAQVLDPVFSKEGYKIDIKEPNIELAEMKSLGATKKGFVEEHRKMSRRQQVESLDQIIAVPATSVINDKQGFRKWITDQPANVAVVIIAMDDNEYSGVREYEDVAYIRVLGRDLKLEETEQLKLRDLFDIYGNKQFFNGFKLGTPYSIDEYKNIIEIVKKNV